MASSPDINIEIGIDSDLVDIFAERFVIGIHLGRESVKRVLDKRVAANRRPILLRRLTQIMVAVVTCGFLWHGQSAPRRPLITWPRGTNQLVSTAVTAQHATDMDVHLMHSGIKNLTAWLSPRHLV